MFESGRDVVKKSWDCDIMWVPLLILLFLSLEEIPLKLPPDRILLTRGFTSS